MNAIISPCGQYRYRLTRDLVLVSTPSTCLFVMLNPSTADAENDDPTIRRCKAFATSWGCSRLEVVNLFAMRATDPSELVRQSSPIGPDNDRHIYEASRTAAIVVCAWGGGKSGRLARMIDERSRWVLSMFMEPWARARDIEPKRIGPPTKDGHPRHPLYLRGSMELEILDPWRERLPPDSRKP